MVGLQPSFCGRVQIRLRQLLPVLVVSRSQESPKIKTGKQQPEFFPVVSHKLNIELHCKTRSPIPNQ